MRRSVRERRRLRTWRRASRGPDVRWRPERPDASIPGQVTINVMSQALIFKIITELVLLN